MTGFVYKRAPQNDFHSWVEVYFEDRWYELEAFEPVGTVLFDSQIIKNPK